MNFYIVQNRNLYNDLLELERSHPPVNFFHSFQNSQSNSFSIARSFTYK